ncbi:MAG: 3-oxoacyl-ACP synthase III family protein [Planctomycetia bacterium]
MSYDCHLHAIAHHLPARSRDNEELAAGRPEWNPAKIQQKTGIRRRPVAAPGETALDLAAAAAERLLADASDPARETIDAVVFFTQSPDYFLPTGACLLQHRLGLSTAAAAFDVNLGCSALPYGLWLARSLVGSGAARRVLLLFADTYSRYCDPDDMTTATLFGDGAAALLLGRDPDGALAKVGPSVLGTDGAGGKSLIVAAGAGRAAAAAPADGPIEKPRLYMDGPEVFRFALDRVKPAVDELAATAGVDPAGFDLLLCHQANRFMLESLRMKLKVSAEKLPIDVEDLGNLATASLPVFLSRAARFGWIKPGTRSAAVGFGVGLSWGATLLDWLPGVAAVRSAD